MLKPIKKPRNKSIKLQLGRPNDFPNRKSVERVWGQAFRRQEKAYRRRFERVEESL